MSAKWLWICLHSWISLYLNESTSRYVNPQRVMTMELCQLLKFIPLSEDWHSWRWIRPMSCRCLTMELCKLLKFISLSEDWHSWRWIHPMLCRFLTMDWVQMRWNYVNFWSLYHSLRIGTAGSGFTLCCAGFWQWNYVNCWSLYHSLRIMNLTPPAWINLKLFKSVEIIGDSLTPQSSWISTIDHEFSKFS